MANLFTATLRRLGLVSSEPGHTTPAPKLARTWGRNPDGSPYVTGMTVAELRKALYQFKDTDEVCMAVAPKKYANGGGLPGKLKSVERGTTGQIWLGGLVLDESLE